MCMDVGGGGDQRKCANKMAYNHVATEQQVSPGEWVNVQNEHVCAALVGGGVRAGVIHGVKFQS